MAHAWQDKEVLGWNNFQDVELCGADMELEAPVLCRGDESPTKALEKVITTAQQKRLPPPAFDVLPDDGRFNDVFEGGDLEDIAAIVVGALTGDQPDRMFTQDFPVLASEYAKFSANDPPPRQVRVDTDETYKEFREDHAKPLREALLDRVEALEAALAAHESGDDEFFADASERIARLEDEVEALKGMAENGGSDVPARFPPYAAGKYKCWKIGPVICVSLRLQGPDGLPRVATSGTLIDKHVTDVVGYVRDGGADPLAVADKLPKIAEILGAGALFSQLAAAAPALLAQPAVADPRQAPVLGKMVSQGQPALASVMSLMQRCQQGDQSACKELEKIKAKTQGAGGEAVSTVLGEASARLLAAQAAKRMAGSF